MQTITLEVNDGFLSKFMSLLETIPKDQVKIKTDRYSEEITKRLKSKKHCVRQSKMKTQL